MRWIISLAVTLLAWSLLADAPGKSNHNDKPNPQTSKKPEKPPKNKLPSAPTRLTTIAVSESAIQLKWRDNSKNEFGFQVERAEEHGAFRRIAIVSANTTSYDSTGLKSDTEYCYRVRAYNADGCSEFSRKRCARTWPTPTDCGLVLNSWGGPYPPSSTPELSGAVALASGGMQGLALKRDGTVVGWNYDASPTALPTNLTGVTAIAAGEWHSVALKSNGKVVTWGIDYYGSLLAPTNLTGVTAIAAGSYHTLALKRDGTVVSWGDNFSGQTDTPTNLSGVMAIAAGRDFSLALLTNGTVVSWGMPFFYKPFQITNAIALAAGNSHVLALKSDGTIVGWGGIFPLYPPSVSNVVAISAAGENAVALTREGAVLDLKNQYGPDVPVFNGAVAIAAGSVINLASSTTPNPPRDFVAQVLATNRVLLSWSNNLSAGASIQIERALSDVVITPDLTWTQIASLPNQTRRFEDVTVAAGKVYLYRARLTNACGNTSPESYSGYIKVSPPTEPPYLYAYAFADEARLQIGSSASGITGFKIERAPDVDGSPRSWTQIVRSNATDLSLHLFTDPGLTLSNKYWYRAQVFNGLGESPYSTPASITILPPGAPLSLDAYIMRTRQVALIWSTPAANDQDGYRLERSTNAINGALVWAQIATLSNNFNYPNFADSDVRPNSTNSYRVRAFNKLGDSPYSTVLTVRITPPPAPVLYGNPFGDRAQLYWYLDYLGESESFIVQRAPDNLGLPGSWSQIAVLTNFYANFYEDKGLSPDTTNWYRLLVSNWTGISPFSQPVQVTIVPPVPPYQVIATVGDSNRVLLSLYAGYPPDQDGFRIEHAPDVDGNPGAWHEVGIVSATNLGMASFTHAPVTAGATNWYRVRTFNRAGISPYSDPSRVDVIPPPAPYLTVYNFASQIRLSWTRNYDSYGKVDGFQIERASDSSGVPGVWSPLAIVPSTSDGYVDLNLPPGAQYWYRVRAFNWVGYSAFSDPQTATIRPPRTPYYFSSSIHANGVRLTWLPGFPGDQDGFRVERANDVGGNPGTWTLLATNAGTQTPPGPIFIGVEFIDTNAVANATNWYRVQAYNLIGRSDFTPPLATAVIPPPAPENLSASPFGNQVQLYWDSSYYSYGVVDGFRIERAPDAGGQPGLWSRVATVSNANSGFYVDAGLAANTKYWYRVQAYNWIGNGNYSSTVGVTIVPPAAPSGLTALIGDTNRAYLHWSGQYPFDADIFKIERANDSGGNPGTWSEIATVPATNRYDQVLIDTNAVANSTNWYRVRAFNLAGHSDYCLPARLAIVPPNPPDFLTAATFANSVLLRWRDFYAAQPGVRIGMKIERALDAGGAPGTWQQIAVTNFDSNTWEMNYADHNRPTGLAHWYRVRAFNWVGNSDYSSTVSATIAPPLAPDRPVALIGNTNEVNLHLSTPEPHDQDGFRIERASEIAGPPGVWNEIAMVANSNLVAFNRFVDTNVVAGTTNWYRVRSYNVVGVSDYSDNARIALIPPPSPGDVNAIARSDRIRLWWNPNNWDYGQIQGFELERAVDSSGTPAAWSRIATLTNSEPNFPNQYVDAGLAPDTTYWYRLRAFNWLGLGDYCASISATIHPPPSPELLTATVGTTNCINLSWYPRYPLDQDGFRIERAVDVAGSPGSWFEIGLILATNTWYGIYTDTNALPYSMNWYRVCAFNAAGNSAYSSVIKFAALPPKAPTRPSAGRFANTITLNWSLRQDESILGYKVERALDLGTGPDAWVQISVASGMYQTTFTDTNLSLNVSYWYRVVAYNWIGDSLPSEPVMQFIQPTDAVPDLTAQIGPSNRINLRWTGPFPYDQDGYLLERLETGDWTQISIVTNRNYYPHVVVYGDTNVTTNATYYYRVRAYNLLGLSEYSPIANIATAPPPPPVTPQASPFANSVRIWWNNYPLNQYGHVERIEVEFALDAGGAPGAWEFAGSVSGSENAFTHTGLLANSTYWYRLRSYNWTGYGPYSASVNATIIPPDPPRWLSGYLGSTNEVSLSWSAGYREDQDGFLVEFAPDQLGAPGAWTNLGIVLRTNWYSASFIHSNVIPFTTNWYQVRAFNMVGVSSNSAPLSIAIVPPPAPPYLMASPYSDQINLQWITYYHNPLSGFKLERAPDAAGSPGAWTQIANLDRYSGRYSDTNRMPGETWWYRVRSYNWVGDGDYTTPVKATIVPPSAPYYLETRIGSTNQLLLSWRILSPYPTEPDTYLIERATDNGGFPTIWTEIGSNISFSTTFTDTNVIAYNTYRYRVRIANRAGISAYSQPAVATIQPPPSPRYLSVSRFANQASVFWDTYFYDYGQIDGFKIERAADSGGSPSGWVNIATITNVYLYFTDTNLTSAATYWYRVRAFNWVGDGAYSVASNVTIVPPSVPLDLFASADGESDIRLSWRAGYPTDQQGFKLERSTNALDFWAEIATISEPGSYYTYYSDFGFIPNVTNYYRVRAFNMVGLSGYSTVAGAIHPSGMAVENIPAPMISSLLLTNDDVIITWSAPAGSSVVETSLNLNGPYSGIPESLTTTSGATVATYVDVGARTNASARFYRVRATR